MGRYRVYYDQINQTYFDVSAKNKDEAIEKGRAQWMDFLDEHKHEEASGVERIR